VRIVRVALTIFEVAVPAVAYAAGMAACGGRTDLGLLRLVTDEGIEGHCFLGSTLRPASHDAEALMGGLAPLLLGADPLAREALYRRLFAACRAFGLRPLGTVDVALWDLLGKRAGLPLWRLLGGCREAVPAYASGAKQASPEAYAADAAAAVARGYRAYKLHPPGTPEADIAAAEAVRAAVGPEVTLMLDASFAYSVGDAVRVGRALERLGFAWLEDPLPEYDIAGTALLRRKLDIPILATELPLAGLGAFAPWAAEGATDMLRGDAAIKGGLSAMLKAAHLAEAFGLSFEVHHGGNALHNLAGLHLAQAIPNTRFFEVLLPEESHGQGVLQPLRIDAQGLLRAPEAPGLGAVLDEALIARGRTLLLA
jgi:L-alanine-DL-glutamate epimerase-like enolase superfamily enzyme